MQGTPQETKRPLSDQAPNSNKPLEKKIKLHFLQKLLTLNQNSVVRDVTQQSDLFKIPAENKEEAESTNITSQIYRQLNTIGNQNNEDEDLFYHLGGSDLEEKSSVLNVDVHKKINGLKNKLLKNHVTPSHSINLGDWAVLCSADFTFQNQLIKEFDLTENVQESITTLKIASTETWASLLAQLEDNQSPIDPNSLTITPKFQAIIDTEIAKAQLSDMQNMSMDEKIEQIKGMLEETDFEADRPTKEEIKLLFLEKLLTLKDSTRVTSITEVVQFIKIVDEKSESPNLSITKEIYDLMNNPERDKKNDNANYYKLTNGVQVDTRINGFSQQLNRLKHGADSLINHRPIGDQLIISSAYSGFQGTLINQDFIGYLAKMNVKPSPLSDKEAEEHEVEYAQFNKTLQATLESTLFDLLTRLQDTPLISCSESEQFTITPNFQDELRKQIAELKPVVLNQLKAKQPAKQLINTLKSVVDSKQSMGKFFTIGGLFVFIAGLVGVGLLITGVLPAIAAVTSGHLLIAAAVTAAVGMGTTIGYGLVLKKAGTQMAMITEVESMSRAVVMKERLAQVEAIRVERASQNPSDSESDSQGQLPNSESNSPRSAHGSDSEDGGLLVPQGPWKQPRSHQPSFLLPDGAATTQCRQQAKQSSPQDHKTDQVKAR